MVLYYIFSRPMFAQMFSTKTTSDSLLGSILECAKCGAPVHFLRAITTENVFILFDVSLHPSKNLSVI